MVQRMNTITEPLRISLDYDEDVCPSPRAAMEEA